MFTTEYVYDLDFEEVFGKEVYESFKETYKKLIEKYGESCNLKIECWYNTISVSFNYERELSKEEIEIKLEEERKLEIENNKKLQKIDQMIFEDAKEKYFRLKDKFE